MKKIISLIMALMMFGTTAFANTADDFAGVWKDFTGVESYEMKTVMSAEVNKPLKVFDSLPTEDGIDFAMLMKDIVNSTVTANVSVKKSDDYKKLQMAMTMEFDVPLNINEDLKFDSWARMGMWIDYDLTNPDAPVYEIIIKTPFDDKYQIKDMTNEISVEDMPAPEVIEASVDGMIESIKDNADIKKITDGYRVTFDNAGVFAYVRDALDIAMSSMGDDERAVFESMYGGLGEYTPEILGEDGLVLDLKINKKGDMTLYAESMHFDFNLYDLLEACEFSTEELVREDADIDVTLKAVSEISGHNATEVVFPEITEENAEYIGSYEDDNYYGTPLFLNNEVYYPVDEICEYANGEFTADYADGVLTVVNIEDSVFTVSGTAITMGENVWEREKPQLAETDGVLYATEEVFDVAGFGVSTSYNTETKKFYCYGWVRSYVYFPEIFEEPEVIEEVEEYIPPYLDAYVSSDQVPYVEDGEAFIPVYDLFKAMYPGEFEITMESLDYKATRENHYGIENISVKVGSNSIWVDEEEITFEKPVVNVANIFRAPLEFVENMGFTVNSIWVYEGTSYVLSMPNPNYVE